MGNQKSTCVFANGVEGTECSALKEYLCKNAECPFYKSKDKYYLDANRYCRKRGSVKDDN